MPTNNSVILSSKGGNVPVILASGTVRVQISDGTIISVPKCEIRKVLFGQPVKTKNLQFQGGNGDIKICHEGEEIVLSPGELSKISKFIRKPPKTGYRDHKCMRFSNLGGR